MNFDLSQEQQLLADSLKRFLTNDYTFDARSKIVASPRGWSEKVWAASPRWGCWACRSPRSTTASAAPRWTSCSSWRRSARVSSSSPTADVGLGGQFVARGGSAAQQKRLLPAIAQGKCRLAFAHIERGARYDLGQVGLRARRTGDGFTLDGDKRVVLHGAAADVLVVSARTSGARHRSRRASASSWWTGWRRASPSRSTARSTSCAPPT